MVKYHKETHHFQIPTFLIESFETYKKNEEKENLTFLLTFLSKKIKIMFQSYNFETYQK
jgi:hypothetical protein